MQRCLKLGGGGRRVRLALVVSVLAAAPLPVYGQDPDAAAGNGPWVLHEVTSVVVEDRSTGSGLLPGRAPVRTASGSEYEVSPPLAPRPGHAPRLIVLRSDGIFRILVEGRGPELQGRQLSPPRARIGSEGDQVERAVVVAGRIEGEFLGFGGASIVQLDNGQRWQQTDGTSIALPLQYPAVVVVRDGSSHLMRVTGISEWIPVRRLD